MRSSNSRWLLTSQLHGINTYHSTTQKLHNSSARSFRHNYIEVQTSLPTTHSPDDSAKVAGPVCREQHQEEAADDEDDPRQPHALEGGVVPPYVDGCSQGALVSSQMHPGLLDLRNKTELLLVCEFKPGPYIGLLLPPKGLFNFDPKTAALGSGHVRSRRVTEL